MALQKGLDSEFQVMFVHVSYFSIQHNIIQLIMKRINITQYKNVKIHESIAMSSNSNKILKWHCSDTGRSRFFGLQKAAQSVIA